MAGRPLALFLRSQLDNNRNNEWVKCRKHSNFPNLNLKYVEVEASDTKIQGDDFFLALFLNPDGIV